MGLDNREGHIEGNEAEGRCASRGLWRGVPQGCPLPRHGIRLEV